jgi:hypothetical protein
MVPLDFTTFFAIMAGVGATLFGLIFVAITIRPELARSDHSSLLPQFKIASSYTALLNPLVISLFALVPHTTIGNVTTVMSSIGLVTGGLMGISLVQVRIRWTKKLVGGLFILGSLLLYGFELYDAIRLATTPRDVQPLSDLTTLLIVIYLYGIARAWDLVGTRQFHILDVLTPFVPKRIRESFFDTTQESQESSSQKPKN